MKKLSTGCETAQRGGLSEAARTQSIDPKSVESKTRESKESSNIREKKLLTADGDARNKTHAHLLRKVRANGARKARGEATARAAKAPSTAEGKENRTCAHVEHGFYCLRLLHSSAVALIGGCTVGACTVGGWTVGGWRRGRWTVGGRSIREVTSKSRNAKERPFLYFTFQQPNRLYTRHIAPRPPLITSGF